MASLQQMSPDWANRLFLSPLHQQAYQDLIGLISDLRHCRSSEDFYDFQQDLLGKVLTVQEHRQACRRVAVRLNRSQSIPADAPELRSGGDPHDPDAWLLEVDVCERVDRQLRSVADAMAWRLFGYDRRVIVAFSRSDQTGQMAGSADLAAEQTFLTETWQDDHSFVLLHDLTTCLRIGDATLFKSVGDDGWEASLYEIKTDPNRRRSAQLRRKHQAEEAIRSGGPLPNDADSRFVVLETPYRTHLAMLRDAFELTARRGQVGMKVPGRRSLITVNRRAGIQPSDHTVAFHSDDLVARSPTMPPWAIYPLAPVVCASLIVDMAVYTVTVTGEGLVETLEDAGLRAQGVLPHDQAELQQGQEVLRVHNGVRGMAMRHGELARLAYELTDLTTWATGVRELLAHTDLSERPRHVFADERNVWV